MDKRLVAQSGTMVVPGVLDRSLNEILDQYPSQGTLIKKIVLPRHMRDEAMKALYRMNITNATLFPDLDGLARSMRMEMEVVWLGNMDELPIKPQDLHLGAGEVWLPQSGE